MLSVYLAMLENEDDKERFMSIYNKYAKLMSKIALSITNDETLALDAMDDALTSIAKNIMTFPPESNLKYERAYIQKVIKHAAINTAKKQSQVPYTLCLDAFNITAESTPIKDAIENEKIQIIIQSIDEMTDTYKDVLILRYIHELKENEIASVLGMPKNTVHKKIIRGTKILRECLEGKKIR